MSKDELEGYSNRCVALGVVLTSLGILNRFRGRSGDKWVTISSVGCVAVGAMQFLLAHQLHKRAQRLPG
jgi:hypothetical protein